MKKSFSKKLRIEYGVPNGSVLVLLLSKTNSIYMFCEYSKNSHIESYADDTTLYTCASDIITVIFELQVPPYKFSTWFNNNHMKANTGKSYLILTSKTSKKAYFGRYLVDLSLTKKFLGIETDSDLAFGEHISFLCNKVENKINVLSGLVNYMPFDKGR